MKKRTCIVVGAGITGAAAAWYLMHKTDGWRVIVYEAQPLPGGQLRGGFISNVPLEPHGPHIFHTASEEAYELVRDHCELNSYQHEVKTIAGPREHVLSWPLQIGELQQLPEWPQIRDELEELPEWRPGNPDQDNFETYATGLMGKTLYEWCCYGYTLKQWGMEPRLLSSSFAPKRLDLRDDGITKMFRDPYEGWAEGGWHTLVENLLDNVEMISCQQLRVHSLPSADAYVITAPLDDFLDGNPLPWRGVTTTFHSFNSDGSTLPAAVVNYPHPDVPYTRKVETRQMSSYAPVRGTVIGHEYPGAPVKHYPIADVYGENRAWHRELVQQLKKEVPNAVIAGRLACYVYVDIDQAILMGLNAAKKVAGRG